MRAKAAAGPRVPLNPQEAFRQVAMDYGVQALAAELVMKTGTLYNKCDADDHSHHQPTLRDIVRITQATGDYRILDSLDRMFNRAAYDLTPGLVVSDAALLEILCKVGSDHGAMHKALADGLADRRLTRDETALIRAEAFELITSVLTFIHRVEGMVDD
jgi:hypothetical protein